MFRPVKFGLTQQHAIKKRKGCFCHHSLNISTFFDLWLDRFQVPGCWVASDCSIWSWPWHRLRLSLFERFFNQKRTTCRFHHFCWTNCCQNQRLGLRSSTEAHDLLSTNQLTLGLQVLQRGNCPCRKAGISLPGHPMVLGNGEPRSQSTREFFWMALEPGGSPAGTWNAGSLGSSCWGAIRTHAGYGYKMP